MKIYTIDKHGIEIALQAKPGTLAFIFDGSIVSGWPLYPDCSEDQKEWEANDDVGRKGIFFVEKYIIFDKPIWEY